MDKLNETNKLRRGTQKKRRHAERKMEENPR